MVYKVISKKLSKYKSKIKQFSFLENFQRFMQMNKCLQSNTEQMPFLIFA